MCRFISIVSELKEFEEYFKDLDSKTEFYEKNRFILADTFPILPIMTRQGLVKASPLGRNKIYLSPFRTKII